MKFKEVVKVIYSENGATVIEYGHGSIFGFATEKENGCIQYGLVTADKGELDRPCDVFESIKGKPLDSVNPSVVFKFHKKESLKILIDGLQEIHDRMNEI